MSGMNIQKYFKLPLGYCTKSIGKTQERQELLRLAWFLTDSNETARSLIDEGLDVNSRAADSKDLSIMRFRTARKKGSVVCRLIEVLLKRRGADFEVWNRSNGERSVRSISEAGQLFSVKFALLNTISRPCNYHLTRERTNCIIVIPFLEGWFFWKILRVTCHRLQSYPIPKGKATGTHSFVVPAQDSWPQTLFIWPVLIRLCSDWPKTFKPHQNQYHNCSHSPHDYSNRF